MNVLNDGDDDGDDKNDKTIRYLYTTLWCLPNKNKRNVS